MHMIRVNRGWVIFPSGVLIDVIKPIPPSAEFRELYAQGAAVE